MPPRDANKKFENVKALRALLYPEIEPGIISKSMIENAYLNDGKKGLALYLHQLEPVVFDQITSIRLEFRNILRIDHLWIIPNLTKLSLNYNKIEVIENIDMLTSLKELDLSFNHIERIENLEKLVNLEVLSLFDNFISRIENLDALEKLVILSLGNNRITSTDGIERFRFFKDLRVLNLEGNPLAQQPDFKLSLYIAAVLPNVKYYDYSEISDKLRNQGKEMFSRELLLIETNEEKEIEARAQEAQEKFDAERLASSFVEHLNGHQLYHSLWKGDDDGRALMMIGQTVSDLAEEYDKNIYEITQDIYKLGLKKYEERQSEIDEFKISLEEGQDDIQKMGQDIIENFLQYKEKVFEQATECLKAFEIAVLRGEDEDSVQNAALMEKFEKITVSFEDTLNEIWQQLMTQELHLHESIEEATINFQRRIQEMIAKFVEQVQSFFGLLREVTLRFAEQVFEAASHYFSLKMALQDYDNVPPELINCMEDREAVGSLVGGMKDAHIQRIDEREDRLIVRSHEFIANMIVDINKEELVRNRAKILEINTFLDLMTESLASLQQVIHEELINEEG